ncbi:MAG: helix-turn-helix domain-containing protein, partial [Chloroflexota bacterium]|nr:helix-turn-helix domain-containing protein [Chloroflexota bacterium]
SGSAVGAAALPEAARQARFVAALLAAGTLSGPTARFDAVPEMGAFRLLYALWGEQDLTTFAADVLGDLPERDRRGELRRTLLAYLETGGSHVEAAARLNIHRNTLAYRLKQIASLTDHDPADASTRLTLHLALLAAALPPAAE